MNPHLIQTPNGPRWVAIVGSAATKPSLWKSVATAEGLVLEAALLRVMQRVGR